MPLCRAAAAVAIAAVGASGTSAAAAEIAACGGKSFGIAQSGCVQMCPKASSKRKIDRATKSLCNICLLYSAGHMVSFPFLDQAKAT